MNLSEVIESLVEEKGLEKDVLSDIVCQGMLTAYQAGYPGVAIRVSFEKKSGDLLVEAEKTVAQNIEDENMQITLRKAKAINEKLALGSTVWVPFEGKIGRIEILRAKQVIAQSIRSVEASAVYNEFKDRQGQVLQGVVHKAERAGTLIKVQETLGFLPRSLSIPGEKLAIGYPIRVLLKEVLDQSRNENQLIFDRASEDFVQALFELEIPEVFERLVEVKSIVRTPGYKSKVVVISNDSNIDPVGACVGVGGVRIKPILKELGSEKIDVISWTEDLENLVKNSLKPAEVNRIEMSDDNSAARIWLDEDQRSLAIGKMGQNIALASRLTGVHIEIVQDSMENLEQKLSDEF